MLKRILTKIGRSRLSRRKRRIAGFTLLELLVSLIIGTLIVLAMLTLVLNITDTDRKDASRTEVQRDMQLALNYIAQDLREAVFVYDGRCLGTTKVLDSNSKEICYGLSNYLPAGWNVDPAAASTAGGASGAFTPLLAFWKPEDLPSAVKEACEAAAKDTSGAEPTTKLNDLINKDVPCISGRSYTLLVYGLDTRNADKTWKGRARLSRYRLSQYSETFSATNPQNNTGWVNPKATKTTQFIQWPFIVDDDTGASTNGQAARPTNLPEVLVDFVDNGVPASRTPATSPPACAAPSVPTFYNTDPTNPFPANTAIPGLYGCVRGMTVNAPATEQVVNQEVRLTLVGNVEGRGGFPFSNNTPYNTSGKVFPLQTVALTRGILEKGAETTN